MGLRPLEVKKLTLAEYALMYIGYHRRHEQKWNHTRHLMYAVINFGGMGTTTPIPPSQIWPLDMDTYGEIQMITTMAQAIQLLREFK